MTAFAGAVDALFADPHLGLDALWFLNGQGAGLQVRVMRQLPDLETPYGQTRILSDVGVFAVRVAEVPDPGRGDRIEVDGETFLVQGAPKRDRLRLYWTVEADPQ